MALTISSDLTVITNGNDGTWTDVGGGGGSASEPDYFIQGTGCRSRAVSGATASRGMTVDIGSGNELDFSSTGTEEDMLVYFWIQDYTPGLTDNVATAPGLTIRIAEGATNGSDYAEWDIMYSDLLAAPGTDFFRVYALDPRCPPTRTSGTWDYNTCRHFGAVLDTNASAKGQNIGIDRISYGFGEIIVTGTATSAASGFEEIVSANWSTVNDSVAIGSTSTARNGVLVNKAGINYVKGKLVIGDGTGTAATTFTGQDSIFVWEDTYYYDGTRIRSTVGYDHNGNYTGKKSDGTSYYGIDLRGNATGATNVTFGAAVGTTRGRSGPTFIGSDLTPTVFAADDGSVEDVKIYGTTFDKFRELDFASNASTDLIRSCTFKRCGPLDIGPVEGRNNTFISGIGGGYTFLETFKNIEGGTLEQLSTADPSTEWTDLLNGAAFVVDGDNQYLTVTGGAAATHITHLDDDKVGSDNHYAEMVVRFPNTSTQTLGPCIAVDSAAQDYFYLDIDITNDQVELFRVTAGSDTSIAGPTAFTMDTDEDYLVLLRRNGTTVEAFISGNSVADGYHTTKVSATDANHTGTGNRLQGIRTDRAASSFDAEIRNFGVGPITDNLGSLVFPATASENFESANFIECARALSWDTTGTYTLNELSLSNNLVAAHNDSAGLVTGSFVGGSGVPANVENLGAGTNSFSADVNLSITVKDNAGTAIDGARVRIQETDGTLISQGSTNVSGVYTATYSYSGDTAVQVRVRKSSTGSTRYFPNVATGTIDSDGLTLEVRLRTDSIVSA